ncbi:MAG: alanine racemase [Nitrospirales bacterium]|nr:MAG: alanine racemase [Nitrospirales bacterium]
MIPPSTVARPSTTLDLSPITATITLSALAHNLSELRRLVHPTCDILAVVKADAYGHGAPTITQALIDLGIQRFGVATVQEGSALRAHGVTQPILVMGGLIPSHIPELIHQRLTPVLSHEDMIYALAESLPRHAPPYPVHTKVDTGMRRLGFNPESVVSWLDSKPFESKLAIEGVMTHLADADDSNQEFTEQQLACFQTVLTHVKRAGHSIALIHAANSAGIMYHPSSHFTMVRPGLMLYGYTTRKPRNSDIALQPVMNVSTHVVHVRSAKPEEFIGYSRGFKTTRTSKIAVLPVGYAHGYSRSLSNRGMVLIQGQRVPIIGKICMDMMLVDVTDLAHVGIGEEVVLVGKQEHEEISVEEIADSLGTLPYEVLCNIGTRAHHVYRPH